MDGVKGATALLLNAAKVAGRAIGRWIARANGRRMREVDMLVL